MQQPNPFGMQPPNPFGMQQPSLFQPQPQNNAAFSMPFSPFANPLVQAEMQRAVDENLYGAQLREL